jgi:hypothetical protein
MRDQWEIGLALVYFFPMMGLISGIFLFLRGSANKELSALMSAAGLPYWLVLWLAVTLYMCCPLMLLLDNSGSVPLALVLAPMFQLAGCLYLVVWRRRSGNHEAFRTAFRSMLAAPFTALLCLGIVFLLAIILTIFGAILP